MTKDSKEYRPVIKENTVCVVATHQNILMPLCVIPNHPPWYYGMLWPLNWKLAENSRARNNDIELLKNVACLQPYRNDI